MFLTTVRQTKPHYRFIEKSTLRRGRTRIGLATNRKREHREFLEDLARLFCAAGIKPCQRAISETSLGKSEDAMNCTVEPVGNVDETMSWVRGAVVKWKQGSMTTEDAIKYISKIAESAPVA